MEQARRLYAEDQTAQAGDREQPAETVEKVLRFAAAAKPYETGQPVARQNGPVTAREFASAMDFVHEAASAVRAAEDRARDAEARALSITQRAVEEMKSADARIQALETRVRTSEARAQEAESHAKEADAWLRKIFSTISEELPVRRPA